MRISKSELKFLRSLSQKKTRDQEKKFLVEGWKVVQAALDAEAPIDLVGITAREKEEPNHLTIVKEIQRRKIRCKELTDFEMKQISETVHNQGIIAVLRQEESKLSDDFLKNAKLLVALDGVSDPGNMGSILRTCDWFGVDAVLLGEGCVSRYNEKVVRSTAGSIFHVPAVQMTALGQTLSHLKKLDFKVLGSAPDGETSVKGFVAGERAVLVIGSEAKGIRQEIRSICTAIVNIPRIGRAESLNVGVACGILLSHLLVEGHHAA